MGQFIYLDNASSTPCDPLVVKEILPYFSQKFANPANTSHYLGEEVFIAVERARKMVAEMLHCGSQNIFWTSGATESNNIAIQGLVKCSILKNKLHRQIHCITSSIEHKSVLETIKSINKLDVSLIRPTPDGLILTSEVEKLIRPTTLFVSLMAANNELGVLNNIYDISNLCSKRGIIFHTDATQIVGKIPIDLSSIKIDFLSFSGHKMYAPKGIGALYIRDYSLVRPICFGGGHENRLRPGTLNVPGIIGLGKASEICKRNQVEENGIVDNLRNLFEESLLNFDNRILVNGHNVPRIANISNISFPIKKGKILFNELRNIACSVGSACDKIDNQPSHVLLEIGKNIHEAKNTIRFSFGRFNCEEDIRTAVLLVKNGFLKCNN